MEVASMGLFPRDRSGGCEEEEEEAKVITPA